MFDFEWNDANHNYKYYVVKWSAKRLNNKSIEMSCMISVVWSRPSAGLIFMLVERISIPFERIFVSPTSTSALSWQKLCWFVQTFAYLPKCGSSGTFAHFSVETKVVCCQFPSPSSEKTSTIAMSTLIVHEKTWKRYSRSFVFICFDLSHCECAFRNRLFKSSNRQKPHRHKTPWKMGNHCAKRFRTTNEKWWKMFGRLFFQATKHFGLCALLRVESIFITSRWWKPNRLYRRDIKNHLSQ